MKTIIVLFCIYYAYSSVKSCLEERDKSKCEVHKIDISDYSCFKIDSPDRLVLGEIEIKTKFCSPFPEKSEEQKSFWKLHRGFIKELNSASKYENFSPILSTGEKDFYKKGEEVIFKNISFSEEDKKIINSENTCSYHLYGRYTDNSSQYMQGYPNVTDPNLCFNAEKFNDLKGILNCGIANISYRYSNSTYNFNNTCIYSVSNRASQSLQKYFKTALVDGLFGYDGLITRLISFRGLVGSFGNFKLSEDKLKRKEQLNNNEYYEIIVKDKNGKITKYSSDSEEIQVINEGNPENDDDDYDEDDIQRVDAGNSIALRLNVITILLFIILNL